MKSRANPCRVGTAESLWSEFRRHGTRKPKCASPGWKLAERVSSATGGSCLKRARRPPLFCWRRRRAVLVRMGGSRSAASHFCTVPSYIVYVRCLRDSERRSGTGSVYTICCIVRTRAHERSSPTRHGGARDQTPRWRKGWLSSPNLPLR